ncbi:nitroreductase family protein [Methylovirgula sp. 4M-Z18]|uniref:nitroreductase family protein n=1 Tax=Methylovirgula sp. 4M-Z18 TaxID=2293567 RepID=UPI000E2FB05E|nr:nitroreductase family protein [Methylovirgula sp. 4M-Z18]RFB76494.1 SagB/ThcOx family dehydrogenase [Methylovirgula sp. 4M-Z18]
MTDTLHALNASSEASTLVVSLSPPVRYSGIPLLAALKFRRSTRHYDSRPIPHGILSDLLWAAFGINRPNGDRTAPSWRHAMITDLYVARADGVYLYDPQAHALRLHTAADIRSKTGSQDFVTTAPVELIYVAHGERMVDVTDEERRLYASVDAAFIGENIYLFCASEGLGTVFRGAVDTKGLGQALRLPEGQFVTFVQTIGYAAVN